MEALALLLNIPPSKTLLRRHLATHFHLLVGAEAQREKQECLENPDYSVLTATARVKVMTFCVQSAFRWVVPTLLLFLYMTTILIKNLSSIVQRV